MEDKTVKDIEMEKTQNQENMNKLPIVEVFTSIQGEGDFVGEPSVFVRLSGCNLRCCFKDSVCDTPYTSFYCEKPMLTVNDVLKELTDHPNVDSIVITGGEPLLYGAGIEEMILFLEQEMGHNYWVTVETNGTMPCADPEHTRIDMFSISPKLSTSVPVPDKVYQYPAFKDGKWIQVSYVFTKEMVDKLNRTRYAPENTANLMKASDFQLKFVYSGPQSVKDIDEFLRALDACGAHFVNRDVKLMPEGTTNEVLTRNAQEAARVCIERGWVLCDRLHIRVWGDKRGV